MCTRKEVMRSPGWSSVSGSSFPNHKKKEEATMFTPQSNLFKGLKPQAIDEIVKLGVDESLPKGAFVYKKGDPTHCFYILKEGKVRLRIGEAGQIDYMACDPGEAFGLSCLAGQDAFATSAECLEKCRLVKIDKNKLAQVFAEDPASGLAFYKVLAGLLNQRLIKTHGMVLAAYKGAGPPSYG